MSPLGKTFKYPEVEGQALCQIEVQASCLNHQHSGVGNGAGIGAGTITGATGIIIGAGTIMGAGTVPGCIGVGAGTIGAGIIGVENTGARTIPGIVGGAGITGDR